MSNADSIYCPNCGHANRSGARFCGKCGKDFASLSASQGGTGAGSKAQSSVPPSAPPAPPQQSAPAPSTPSKAPAQPSGAGTEDIFCPNCGRDVTPGAYFCRHCGVTLSQSASTRSPSAVVSTPPAVTPAAVVTPPSVAGPQAQPQIQPQIEPTPTNASNVGRRGAPGWVWGVIGVVIGLLIGAGVMTAFPGIPMLLDPLFGGWTEGSTATVVPTGSVEPTTIPAAGRDVTPSPEAVVTSETPTAESGISGTVTATVEAATTTTAITEGVTVTASETVTSAATITATGTVTVEE